MKSSFLFGPFIGELSWEFYRFAPYAIYLKKIFPKYQLIVLTRKDRFDLYGQYADYLSPLKIDNDDDIKNQVNFKMKNFSEKSYNILAKRFNKAYLDRFIIEKHCYPKIEDYQYQIRWQFPRAKMNYDFKPRLRNYEIINNTFTKKIILFTPPYNNNFMSKITSLIIKNKLNKKYVFVSYGYSSDIFNDILKIDIDENSSILGLLIEVLKRSILTIGQKSELTHLSLLLKVPTIIWGEKTNIELFNPLKTRVFLYDKLSYEVVENKLLKELKKLKGEEIYNCV